MWGRGAELRWQVAKKSNILSTHVLCTLRIDSRSWIKHEPKLMQYNNRITQKTFDFVRQHSCWSKDWKIKINNENQVNDKKNKIKMFYQWWSIFKTHRLQTEQWWARSGLIEQHFGHLKMTSPSRKPIIWMFSLVALPFGTAPGSENIDFRWLETARNARRLKRSILIVL